MNGLVMDEYALCSLSDWGAHSSRSRWARGVEVEETCLVPVEETETKDRSWPAERVVRPASLLRLTAPWPRRESEGLWHGRCIVLFPGEC